MSWCFTLLAAFGAAFLIGKLLGLERDMTVLVGGRGKASVEEEQECEQIQDIQEV